MTTGELIQQSRQTRERAQELRAEIAKLRQAIHAQRTTSLIFHDLVKQGAASPFYSAWRAGQ